MDLLERIRQEAHVIKSAPWSFILFLIVGGSVGYGSSSWYYSKQIGDKEDQIRRYQVVLGIKPGSAGALVELTNEELALKTQSIVAQLRELSATFDEKSKAIQKQVDAKRIDKDQAFEDEQAAMQEVSQDFDSNLASDADNLRNELRKRLDPAAIAHVVRVPAFKAENGSSVPVTALFRGSGFDTFFIRGLADEIEEMAKLLPPGSAKP
jgi:hypothetical protein